MSDQRPSNDAPLTIDVQERAGHHTGNPQVLNSRLFMQLMVFDCDRTLAPKRAVQLLRSKLRAARCPVVIYADVGNPRGLGVLTYAEDPARFVDCLRAAFEDEELAGLTQRPEMTMMGRTYATGYEPDLPFWLLERPAQTVQKREWPWAVWYPLRRSGAFARLEPREQGAILREHATIGRAYGEQDLAHDVRLACHGIDAADNEFVVGLVGKELHPLSHVVQSMRKTRQTSEFITQMGPFFVGRVLVQDA